MPLWWAVTVVSGVYWAPGRGEEVARPAQPERGEPEAGPGHAKRFWAGSFPPCSPPPPPPLTPGGCPVSLTETLSCHQLISRPGSPVSPVGFRSNTSSPVKAHDSFPAFFHTEVNSRNLACGVQVSAPVLNCWVTIDKGLDLSVPVSSGLD